MELFYVSLYCVSICIGSLYWWLRRRFSYWASRGVVHDQPSLFYGNMKEVGRTQSFRDPFYEFYQRHKGSAPFGGFYLKMRHAAVLLDLDLVKNVLIKDFANFSSRGVYHNVKYDPLSGHLFNLDGPKWKRLRAKLTPTFTSGKMKFMFPTIVEVAEKFVEIMNELMKSPELDGSHSAKDTILEMKDLMGRFTTDVIGSCAFGYNCNSLKDPNTKFRLMGKRSFSKRRHGYILTCFMNAFPEIAKKLGLIHTPKGIDEFFMGIVRDTVGYREREKIQRNDFMNLLIELKNNNEIDALTLEEIAAQAFIFFLAGYETSSSSMGFCLYELATHQDIQDRVREEITETIKRHGGKFTYEGMREMKYLKQCLHETMRLYSVASILMRKTLSDYPVPDSKLVIEKDIMVVIPIDAIHRDPDIYPEPDIFDPERFTPKAVERRHPMSFLPFGDGPRNCIALRFGEMQAMIGLAFLLRDFRFSAASQTQIPIVIDIKSVILSSKDGTILKVEKI